MKRGDVIRRVTPARVSLCEPSAAFQRHSCKRCRFYSRIRILPKSRLRKTKASEYILNVAKMKPEDGITALVSDPFCDDEGDTIVLVSGLPVYDDRTEEVFGVVMIECDIQRVLRRQFSRQLQSSEVVAFSDTSQILMRTNAGQLNEDSINKPVAKELPHFQEVALQLQNNWEYIDESDANVYGVRVSFTHQHGLTYLLKRK